MGNQLVPYATSCCKLLRDHSLLTFSICFLAILYRSFPFLFHLLVQAFPVLIGTALLLGLLLSYGELEQAAESSNEAPEKEEEGEHACHADSSLRADETGGFVSAARSENAFVTQSLREYVPLTNQEDNPSSEEVQNDVEEDHEEDSESESIIRESSIANASMENIDELHPLLQSDSVHTHIEEEESESSEDQDDEEEEANKEDDESSSAIKWTADDEKNLMDLGYLELERNQRLETLLLRRRARSHIKPIAERNLIDFDGTDSLNFPSISTKRQNPFDLPFDLMDEAPGSAPSVLHARINPFDRFSKEESSVEVPVPQAVYSRHASFHVGSSFWELPRHFVPETLRVEENDFEMHDEENEVEEYPSDLVKHGSVSSEDAEQQQTKDRVSTASDTSSDSVSDDADRLGFEKLKVESFEEIAVDVVNDTEYEDLNKNINEETSGVKGNEIQNEDSSRDPGTSRHTVPEMENDQVDEVNDIAFEEQIANVMMDDERKKVCNRSASEASSRSGTDRDSEEDKYCFEEQQSSVAIDDSWHKDSDPVSGTSSSSSSDSENQEEKRCVEIAMDYESQIKDDCCVSGTSSSSGSDTEKEEEKHCCEEQSGGMDRKTQNRDSICVSGTLLLSGSDTGIEEEKHCVVEQQSSVAVDCVSEIPGTLSRSLSGTEDQKIEGSNEYLTEESAAINDESREHVRVPETLSRSVSEMKNQDVDKKTDYEPSNNRVPVTPSSSASDSENVKPMDNFSVPEMSSSYASDTFTKKAEESNKKLPEESVGGDDGPQVKDPVYDSSPSSADQVLAFEPAVVNSEPESEVSLPVELGLQEDEKVKDICHVGKGEAGA